MFYEPPDRDLGPRGRSPAQVQAEQANARLFGMLRGGLLAALGGSAGHCPQAGPPVNRLGRTIGISPGRRCGDPYGGFFPSLSQNAGQPQNRQLIRNFGGTGGT